MDTSASTAAIGRNKGNGTRTALLAYGWSPHQMTINYNIISSFLRVIPMESIILHKSVDVCDGDIGIDEMTKTQQATSRWSLSLVVLVRMSGQGRKCRLHNSHACVSLNLGCPVMRILTLECLRPKACVFSDSHL